MNARLTRRSFLGVAAAACTAKASELPSTRLSPFSYSDICLLPGPLQRQFEQNHAFFLNRSEDRLLKIYRQRAGLPAPGPNMGGWYDDFCPGAHFGQYVSALARFAAQTDSQETRAKVQRLVHGYAQTLDRGGKFFIDLRYPAYTYDKLVCGLIDAHSYAADKTALAVLNATTRAAQPHMPDHALTKEEQLARPHKDETYTWDESYTLAENLFLAYDRSGDRKYFEMGSRYLLDRTFFDPLSQGVNVLPGLHAYSHMNALSSGMQGYFKLGDRKYLDAVTNAVEWIWRDQTYATGGWGPNEGFVEPGNGRLGASLSTTHRSFETPCGAYAHFKLMRYLLALTADPRYGDSLEQVLYNTVLGAKPIREDGWSFYYSDYGRNAHKTDHRIIADSPWPWDHDGRWPCCSGTLPQAVADYGISAYFRSPDGVYLNLYVPSELRWQPRASVECKLTIETNYPVEDLIRLQVDPSSPADFRICLRIPSWAGPHTSLSVNGRRLPSDAVRPGTFASIAREWKRGDRIEMELHQTVRTQAVDRQTPDQVALLRGPLVLFALCPEQAALTRSQAVRPQISTSANGGWTCASAAKPIHLRPFYQIQDETYQTYWKVNA